MRLLRLPVLAVIALSAAAQAEIDYNVQADASSAYLNISVTADVKGNTTAIEMPRWAPGSYRYAENQRRVTNLTAVDGYGRPVKVEMTGKARWEANTPGLKRITFKYQIPVTITKHVFHYAGPSTYIYFPDRIKEPCNLSFDLPEKWKTSCGLEKGPEPRTYIAPDYDVLTDNPVTAGLYREDSYTYDGITHSIVYHSGGPNQINRSDVIDRCLLVTKAHDVFFNGLPFKKYVWHFRVNNAADGAGGLEHLSSTQISLANGLGPRAVSVLSHEYFHAWNVKRIRSLPLGPFNYQELPQTGALWWLEGVTDYYADVLLKRGGYQSDEDFYGEILSNTTRTNRDEDRLTISPYEASFRVRDANNGVGNSAGFGVNYYNTGWVAGFCLDAEIRHLTGGEKSLDDVTLDLWDMNKDDQPGFSEGTIRELLIKHGGPTMGDRYDEWIMQPGTLPVKEQLAKLGLLMGEMPEEYTQLGFSLRASRLGPDARVFGITGPAAEVLQSGDVVVDFNGIDLTAEDQRARAAAISEALSSAKPGAALKLKVRRDDQMVDVTVTPESKTRQKLSITVDPNSTPEQTELREDLLKF
jgi:predicted metalloprotease with PDZ domain